MNPNDKTTVITNSLNCTSCGSILHFEPGTKQLKCESCGNTNDIDESSMIQDIESYDYEEFINNTQSIQSTDELQTVKCKNCGSETTFNQNITADKCPFCSSPLILELDDSQQYLKPHYILPFVINEEIARQNFKNWIKNLSFAPGDLLQKVNNSSSSALTGIYLPYWAYDADAHTNYEGNRGDYYYVTETYTVEVDGEEEIREREVCHTNWSVVSGEVSNSFQNILIPASKSLSQEILSKMGSWYFNELVEYNEMYLSGFLSENYQLSPQDGLELAKISMSSVINKTILEDIGGNEQSIINSSTQLENIGIKYIILPVWMSTYSYNNKIYQFTINACTGEVNGTRPRSAIKIAALIVIIFMIIAVIIFAYMKHK